MERAHASFSHLHGQNPGVIKCKYKNLKGWKLNSFLAKSVLVCESGENNPRDFGSRKCAESKQ